MSAKGRKIFVHTAENIYWEYCIMDAVLKHTSSEICRCHHSLAINLSNAREVSQDGIVFTDGTQVNMCRAALQRAKKALIKYRNEQGLSDG
jgi:DNA-binding LytR/AlgR family response regulator